MSSPALGRESAPVSVIRPTLGRRLRLHQTTIGIFVVAVLLYLVTLIFVPGFTTLTHFFDTLQLAAFLGIIAAGEGIVILTSGIDLSTASVITAIAILESSLFATSGLPALVVVAIGLGAAAGIGLVNGVGVAWFRIPPLVMTLASGSVIQGFYLVATGGSPTSGTSTLLVTIANKDIGAGLTGSVIVWLVVIILMLLLLNATRIGRYVYGTGTNVKAAQLAGVPVARVIAFAYSISGLAAGITGTLLLGWTGISFTTMGDPYLLPAIAAVVLGGASILGGRGNIIGIALGAFLITILESLLAVAHAGPDVREMLEGIILLLVVVLYNLRSAFATR